MPAKSLYHTLFKQIALLRPGERITRLRNMTWLLVGIYLSRSVHLSRIALKIPGTAEVVSIVRRLSRFLDNPAIRVREWFEPIARGVLQAAVNFRPNDATDFRLKGCHLDVGGRSVFSLFKCKSECSSARSKVVKNRVRDSLRRAAWSVHLALTDSVSAASTTAANGRENSRR
jgi:hypothetical protein